VGFPSVEELKNIVTMTQATMEETAEAVIDGAELLKMRETAKEIPVADEVLDYTARLVAATHPDTEEAAQAARKYVKLGASPRAAQALITGAKVRALLNGRYNVSRDDINTLAYPVLRHRIKLSFDAVTEKKTADDVIDEIIDEVASGKKPAVVAAVEKVFKKK